MIPRLQTRADWRGNCLPGCPGPRVGIDGDTIIVESGDDLTIDPGRFETTLLVMRCETCGVETYEFDLSFANRPNPFGNLDGMLGFVNERPPDEQRDFAAEDNGLAWTVRRRTWSSATGPIVIDTHTFGPFARPIADFVGQAGVSTYCPSFDRDKPQSKSADAWEQARALFWKLAPSALSELASLSRPAE
jgi:hypothetical protein